MTRTSLPLPLCALPRVYSTLHIPRVASALLQFTYCESDFQLEIHKILGIFLPVWPISPLVFTVAPSLRYQLNQILFQ